MQKGNTEYTQENFKQRGSGVCLLFHTYTHKHSQKQRESRIQRVSQRCSVTKPVEFVYWSSVISEWRDNHTLHWHVETAEHSHIWRTKSIAQQSVLTCRVHIDTLRTTSLISAKQGRKITREQFGSADCSSFCHKSTALAVNLGLLLLETTNRIVSLFLIGWIKGPLLSAGFTGLSAYYYYMKFVLAPLETH